MYYFMPILAFHIQMPDSKWENLEQQKNSSKKQREFQFKSQYSQKNEQNSIDNWDLYLKFFEEELEILKKKQKKKIWSPEEDRKLLNLNQQDIDWKDISKIIPGVSSQICKRRYYRLVEKNLRWPKEVDDLIKTLRQDQCKKWCRITQALSQRFGNRGYTGKMVKQRYQFYLKQGILEKQWPVQDDITLLKQVQQKGRYWKNILPSFPGRTQLQLKNRYNGTLKLVQKRVLAKLKLNLFSKN